MPGNILMSGPAAIGLSTARGAGGPTLGLVYRSRTTPESSLNYAFFDDDAFDVESWPLDERIDVLTDLVLHQGFTINWDIDIE